ncbi:hypothetical protein [Pseudolysinimonas sp.]|uniref:hypothetical protein n=1 Tax=Pseudolysinimonas sp. TaxID=2680009 RepID=UPI00286C545C|nr:hypothetical protein [Pseudolysinimonas sp.]
MKRAPLIVIIVLSVLVVGLGAVLAYRLFFSPDAPPPSVLPSTPPAAAPTATPTPTGEFTSEGGTPITVDEWSDSPVGSPLTLSGEVPGNWSSGGSFAVQLTDQDGNVLDDATAQLEGDWMTEELVPFTVTLNFDRPADVTSGFLVLKKENPSGLPENDDSLSIPVTFS